MEIINGKKICDEILENIKDSIQDLAKKPHLAVVLVGEDFASQVYVNIKQKACEKIGFTSTIIKFPSDVEESTLLEKIEELNNNKGINAILLQLPLPKHLDETKCLNQISKLKDVDGFTLTNIGMLNSGATPFAYPCTPLGIITLLDMHNIQIEGKHAVVVGRSNIVGKPIAQMLLNRNATVTICHSKTVNLQEMTKTADILISATGRKIIFENMVKEGATVIDVGIFKDENGNITGDVDFENVKNKTSYITPVPKGVGPMTIACLMKNTLHLYHIQNKKGSEY